MYVKERNFISVKILFQTWDTDRSYLLIALASIIFLVAGLFVTCGILCIPFAFKFDYLLRPRKLYSDVLSRSRHFSF